MSANVNIKIGRLAADPESKQTKSGKNLTTFRIAVNEGKDETLWFNVVTFGKTAENCAKYLEKGRMVFINGRDKVDSWQDDDGRWNNRHEIIAHSVKFLSGDKQPGQQQPSSYGGAPQGGGYGGQQGGYQGYNPGQSYGFGSEGSDDGVPF